MHPFFADHRAYSPGEIRADALVHGAGIVGGAPGGIILLAHAGVSWVLASYLFGLLAMMIFSAAYNLTPPSHLKWLLRRFDHSAIYLLIAGTYTPLLPYLPDATQSWTLGLITWLGAAFGVLVKFAVPRPLRPPRHSGLSRLGLGRRHRGRRFHASSAAAGYKPDRRRRCAIYRRRHLPHLGTAEIPQCHLAWLRSRCRRLPLRRNHAALLVTQVFLAHPCFGLVERHFHHVKHLVNFFRGDDQRRAEGD